jgi:hypothetical protein
MPRWRVVPDHGTLLRQRTLPRLPRRFQLSEQRAALQEREMRVVAITKARAIVTPTP